MMVLRSQNASGTMYFRVDDDIYWPLASFGCRQGYQVFLKMMSKIRPHGPTSLVGDRCHPATACAGDGGWCWGGMACTMSSCSNRESWHLAALIEVVTSCTVKHSHKGWFRMLWFGPEIDFLKDYWIPCRVHLEFWNHSFDSLLTVFF